VAAACDLALHATEWLARRPTFPCPPDATAAGRRIPTGLSGLTAGLDAKRLECSY